MTVIMPGIGSCDNCDPIKKSEKLATLRSPTTDGSTFYIVTLGKNAVM